MPHRLLIRSCGMVAAAAGIIALLAWGLRPMFLAGLGSRSILMAPSTALLFVLYGAVALLRTRSPLRRGEHWLVLAAHCGGTLVAVLLCLLSYQRTYLGAEHLGFPDGGAASGAPLRPMSPVTALCFLVASLSLLASLPSSSNRRWRAAAAWCLASLLLAVCFVVLLVRLYGTPLLFGSSVVPSAVTSCLAFLALGTALLALAGPQAWPRREPDGTAIRPAPVLFLLFVLPAVGIMTAGYLYVRSYHVQYRAEVERQLSSIAELKVSELVQYRKGLLGDGSIVFRNAAFSALAERVLDNGADRQGQAELQAWLGKYRAHHQYDAAFLLDAQGAVRMAASGTQVPLASLISQRAPDVLRSGQVVLQDFYRNEYDHGVYLAVLVPILGGRDGRRPLGLLVLRIDPQTYLYPFLSHWPTPSETAETLLVRREGNEILLLNELRLQKNTALNHRIPVAKQDAAAVRAVLGQEGVVDAVDYRHVPVIASLHSIPDSPWFLIARMDASEVYASLRERMWMTLVLVGVLLISAGAGVAGFWLQQHARSYREKSETHISLRESQAALQAILHSTADGILAVGRDNNVLLANQRFVDMWAIPQDVMASNDDSVLLRHVLDQLTDPQGFLHKVQELYQSTADSFDTLHFKDGRIFDRFSRPLVHGTELRGRVWSFRDMTAHRRAEELLRHSERRFRGVFEKAPLGIALIDSQSGRFLQINQTFCDIVGYGVEEMLQLDFQSITHPDDLTDGLDRMKRLRCGEIESFSMEKRYHRKDGTLVWVGLTVNPMWQPGETPSSHIAMVQDITERKQAEQTLRDTESQLRLAQKMEALGTLAGGIAHDFNNILGAVIGNVELAAQDVGPSHAAMESLNEIRTASCRAKELVQRILTFSRRQPQVQSLVSLHPVVEEAVTLLRATLPASVEVVTIFDAGAPAVLADPTQIHQIVMNLCTNAWHAMEGRAGRIEIRLDAVTLDAAAAGTDAALWPGDFVRLSVTDTGAGMDAVTLERIYEPFFTTKPLGQGTGLGLSVAHGIVKAHGGAITVSSEPDRGTTFRLYFPAVRASEHTAAPQQA